MPDSDDNALVKMRTLQRVVRELRDTFPRPGPGIGVRRGVRSEVWAVRPPEYPLSVSTAGKVWPGLVGGIMPTLDGEPLDTTDKLLDLSIDGPAWFELTFTIAFTETYLSSWTLDAVTVQQGAALPADTDDVKCLHFATISGGRVASLFTASIPLFLSDAGADATALNIGYFT